MEVYDSLRSILTMIAIRNQQELLKPLNPTTLNPKTLKP